MTPQEEFLIKIALEKEFITRMQLERAVSIRNSTEDKDIGEIFVELGFITKEHLIKADEEVTILEEEMAMIFSQMNKDEEMSLAADVLIFIRSSGKIKKNDLYREFFKIMNYNTFERIMRSLTNSNLVQNIDTGMAIYIEATEKK